MFSIEITTAFLLSYNCLFLELRTTGLYKIVHILPEEIRCRALFSIRFVKVEKW